MKQLLIKLAHNILKKFTTETAPVFYFNGTKFITKCVEWKYTPDGKETLVISAGRETE